MVDQPKDTKPEGTEKKKVSPEESKSESTLTDIKSKIPDLSTIAKKIDLDGILSGIKSMINPEGGATAKIDPNDDLGMKVTELSALLQEISKMQAQLSKDYSKANDLLVALFKDVEAIRAEKKNPNKDS